MDHCEHELPDLLRPDTSLEQRARIESHLATCASCRAVWDEMASLGSVDRSRRPEVPDGYFATLPARILERRMRPAKFRERFAVLAVAGRALLPVAAGVLVIVALARFSTMTGSGETSNTLPVPTTEVLEYVAQEEGWSAADLSVAAEALLTDRRYIVSEAYSGTTTGLEDLDVVMTPDLTADLNDAEIDQIITRLSERTLL